EPRTPPGMDHARDQIQTDLEKILECQFGRGLGPNAFICYAKATGSSIKLFFNANNQLETVETDILVLSRPRRQPRAEKAAEQTAQDVIDYLLPMWLSSDWLHTALGIITRNNAFSIINVPYLVFSEELKAQGYADPSVEVERFTV